MTARPQWLLERAALGEAPDGFDADDTELDELRASNAAILEALPPAMVATEIDRRVRIARRKKTRSRLAASGAFVAAAAALLLFVSQRGGGASDQLDPAELDSGIRIKGDIRLLVHRKSDAGAVRLAPAALTRADDLLQLSYIAAGRGHGVILSIDGRGSVTLHFPESPDQSTRLVAGKATPLAHAYRLDDAPRFERFFFVASNESVDVERVLEAARRVARSPRPETALLELAPTLEQFSVLMRKPETP